MLITSAPLVRYQSMLLTFLSAINIVFNKKNYYFVPVFLTKYHFVNQGSDSTSTQVFDIFMHFLGSQ